MSEKLKTAAKTPETKSANAVSRKPETASSQSVNSPVDQILSLQRTIGNQAVQRLFKSGAIQAKLKIGKANDIYEQEADRVAEQVMRMPESQVLRQPQEDEEAIIQPEWIAQHITPLAQKQIEEEEDLPLQGKRAAGKSFEVPPDIESHIQTLRGRGWSLPESVRDFFESRLGYDLRHVRVHSDPTAAESAKMLNAKAFTVGNNVVFGGGHYAPGTKTGKRLLAHELTHVIQQEKLRTIQPSILIQRHVLRPSIGRLPRIRGEHPMVQRVTPLLRDLYRSVHYYPWFYRSYLIEALVVSDIQDISSIPSGGFYISTSENEPDRLRVVAFSLLSSQEELAREMGRIQPAAAWRFQDVLASHILYVAIRYAQRNRQIWQRVIQERQRRERERRRRRREMPRPVREPKEALA